MNEKIELVHALVDGELDAATREQVAAWICQDPALNREYLWAVAMKDTLATKCQRLDSPECWEAAKLRFRELDRTRTVNFLVGKYAWALSGVLFAAILAAGGLNLMRRSTTVSSPAVAELVRNPLSGTSQSATGYTSSPYSIVAADGSELVKLANGVQLLGMQPGKVEGKPCLGVAMLDAEGPLKLWAIDGVDGLEGATEQVGYSDFRIGFFNNHPAVTWKKGHRLVVLTSDRDWQKLVEVAKHLR